MITAENLLFESIDSKKPLFENQLDLAKSLLNDNNTRYFVSSDDITAYNKAQTRLRTYISQLLSKSVYRTITEDFKNGISTVIISRLNNDVDQAEKLVKKILESISQKNASTTKTEGKGTLIDKFVSDLNQAVYLSIFTSKPLEKDEPSWNDVISLRKFLLSDLIERLYDKEKDLKYYRYNFPLEATSLLFWRILRRLLFREFHKNPSKELFESLYYKFAIKTDTLLSLEESKNLTDEKIEKLVNETLEHLNRNRHIMVFTTHAPVYGLPLVAMDPSDTKNIKVYYLLEAEARHTSFFKLSEYDSLLWRIFVWDTLKSTDLTGIDVPFKI